MFRTRTHFLSALVKISLAVAFAALVIGATNSSLKAQSRERVGDNSTPQEPIRRRPLDSSSEPQGKAIVTSPSATTVVTAAQTRAWTSAASTGTMDEASAAIAQLKNFTVTLLPGATGTVQIRYNITAVDGINSFCPASQSTIRVRFRNHDITGALSQVSFEIHATDLNTGGNTIIYSFDSNGKSVGSAFVTVTDFPAIDFDFTTKAYWIEATVSRSNSALFADLGTIQIWESAGVACP